MSYQKKILEHLISNKEKFFPDIEKGKWRNRDGYNHIFPEGYESLNLLEPYRNSLWQYLDEKKSCLKTHMYFHHLNSSQAMCMNFFFPLMKEKELEIVLRFMGFKNETINYCKTCFEKKSIVEGKYRCTYFDFFVETNSGKKIFFEIKFTEHKFGEAKQNDIHIEKFNAVYRDKLKIFEEEYHQPAVFFKNYQILRNLVCIDQESYVVFIYPEKNKKISYQAKFAKSNILKSEVKDNLINLTWENLLGHVENNVKNHNLKEQFKSFREKYYLEN